MDFLSSGLFWLFFALTGIFWFILEIGYSGRGILARDLAQVAMQIGGTGLSIITILSFILMWWQGGVAILLSQFIWLIIMSVLGNIVLKFLLQRFRGD